eukprot:1154335-Pelagomonas_calceolata.AAC.1
MSAPVAVGRSLIADPPPNHYFAHGITAGTKHEGLTAGLPKGTGVRLKRSTTRQLPRLEPFPINAAPACQCHTQEQHEGLET